MERLWITNGSTNIAPVGDSLAAATDAGYLPTGICVLENPMSRESRCWSKRWRRHRLIAGTCRDLDI